MRRKRFIPFIIFFALVSSNLRADGYTLYMDQIYQMEKTGHMDEDQAREKVISLQLREEESRVEAKFQARGVASAIMNKKTIKLANKPIEVSVD